MGVGADAGAVCCNGILHGLVSAFSMSFDIVCNFSFWASEGQWRHTLWFSFSVFWMKLLLHWVRKCTELEKWGFSYAKTKNNTIKKGNRIHNFKRTTVHFEKKKKSCMVGVVRRSIVVGFLPIGHPVPFAFQFVFLRIWNEREIVYKLQPVFLGNSFALLFCYWICYI